jgi:hypothetical protein
MGEAPEQVDAAAPEPVLEPGLIPDAEREASDRPGPALGGGRAAAPRAGGGRDDVLRRLARTDLSTRAAALARFQRGAGNRVLAQRLGAAGIVQRQDDAGDGALSPEELTLEGAGYVPLQSGPPQGITSAQPAGATGARPRPTPQSIRHDCADCNDAAAFLNAGNYVGEADVRVAPAAGQVRVSGSGGTFTAEVDISWPIDVNASRIEVTDFVWPNMTDADRGAVAAFRGALLAHEEGHFVEVERVLAGLPTRLTASGASGRAAAAALQARARQQMTDAQTAIDRARDDYDARTQNGRNQAAVGGTNVHLGCPRRRAGAGAPGAATGTEAVTLSEAKPPEEAGATLLAMRRGTRPAPLARARLLRQEAGAPAPAPPAASSSGANEAVVGGWIVPIGREHQRRSMEQMVVEKGRGGPRFFLDSVRSAIAAATPEGGVPEGQGSDDITRAREALPDLQAVVTELEQEIDKVLEDFEARGRQVMAGILDDSETRTKAEGIKYGLTSEQVEQMVPQGQGPPARVMTTKYGMDAESTAAKELSAGATRLAKRARDLKRMRDRKAALTGPSKAKTGLTGSEFEELRQLTDHLSEQKSEYDQLAGELIPRFPILGDAARAEDIDTLDRLAAAPSQDTAQYIGEQIADRLGKIAKLRAENKPGGEVNVLKVPKVVALTKVAQGLTPDTWQMKAVDERVEATQSVEAIVNVALAIINVALLALGPATGGASLIVAAGLSATTAAVHLQEYMLQAAMAGSDLDKARALSAEDPSLFWLAVEIVAAFGDIGTAAGAAAKLTNAFTKLAPLAKEAKAAATAEEAAKAVDALKAEARAVPGGGEALAQRVAQGLEKEGSASRVAKEVEAVEAAGRTAEAELKAAGEAGTKHGHVHVTQRGKLFSCSSPCTELRAKYAETLAVEKNKGLLDQVTALENEARGLGPNPTKTQLDGIAKKLATLDESIEAAARLARAEKIAAWLPAELERLGLKELQLDSEAIARIIEKTNPAHVKGQLMEELMGARVRQMLGSEAGKTALVGKQAAKEALEFIPGHRIVDANGRQFTDGVIAIRRGEQVEVVAVLESKAGGASSRGLRTDWESLAKAKGRTIEDLEKDGLRDLAEARREAIEDLRGGDPKKFSGLTQEEIDRQFGQDVDRMLDRQPKSEAGQVRRDVERLLSGPGAKVDGKPVIQPPDPKTVPIVAAVPSDVNAEALRTAVTEGQAVKKFDVMSMDASSKQLDELAGQIIERAQAPTQ